MKKVLIIIAACNEAASLARFLPKLMAMLKSLSIPGSVLLVDDGSSDNTSRIAADNGCLIIQNHENLGIGASLRSGYKRAIDDEFDFTITMDADGQHDETIVPKVLSILMQDKADFVVASRYHRDSERIGVPLDRDLLNISVTAQMRVLTGYNITDPLSGFWGMTRPCFEFAYANGKQQRYGIHLENLIKFWFLAKPRPRHQEVPHPAIYQNHGTLELLTRTYSNANREDRVHRFGTHALHIIESIEDVKRTLGADSTDGEIHRRFQQVRF